MHSVQRRAALSVTLAPLFAAVSMGTADKVKPVMDKYAAAVYEETVKADFAEIAKVRK